MDVRELRKKHNLTQAQLAVICGVTLRTVQNWEKGRVIPASMLKLLENIDERIGLYVHDTSTAAEGAAVLPDTVRFFRTIEKQQEIITSALEIIANQTQKKDEQIDRLIEIIGQEKGHD